MIQLIKFSGRGCPVWVNPANVTSIVQTDTSVQSTIGAKCTIYCSGQAVCVQEDVEKVYSILTGSVVPEEYDEEDKGLAIEALRSYGKAADEGDQYAGDTLWTSAIRLDLTETKIAKSGTWMELANLIIKTEIDNG